MLQDESEEKGRSLRQSYRECKLEINYACIRNVGQLRWCCAKLRVLKDVFEGSNVLLQPGQVTL